MCPDRRVARQTHSTPDSAFRVRAYRYSMSTEASRAKKRSGWAKDVTMTAEYLGWESNATGRLTEECAYSEYLR